MVTDRVNSLPYWDGRFAADWEVVHGRDQTRFFADLALALWPAWLARRLHDEHWTLCDWGCALGDGSDALARAFGRPVTGVDFSPVAVHKAAAAYPDGSFVADDWLAQSTPRDAAGPGPTGQSGRSGHAGDRNHWDLVFSSNTLEHFADPWAVFAALAERARRCIVLLLPYEEPEQGRTPEHLYRFDRGSIRVCPQPDWVLCDAAVSDLGPSPFWSGQQVLLVYARSAELARTGFSDGHSLHSRLVAAGPQQQDRLARRELDEALRQRDLASAQLAQLAQEQRQLLQQQQAILDSRSWTWTAPLRRLRARWLSWRR